MELWILLAIILVFLLQPNNYLTKVSNATDQSILEASSSSSALSLDNSKCERLDIPFCDGVKYNETIFPNILNHQNQREAKQDINIYWPLLKINCSPDLQLFLCSVYAPICFHDVPQISTVQPCRSLCESAKVGCVHLMIKFGFTWPEQLDCKRFPDHHVDKLCIGRNSSEQQTSLHDPNYYDDTHSKGSYTGFQDDRNHSVPNNGRDLGFACPENFKTPLGYESHVFHLNGKSYKNCGMPCDGVLLNNEDTLFMRKINGLFSTMALLSTSFTCLTFILFSNRFQYPERPMIIISFCYLITAICYLIGFFMEDQLSCNEPFEPSKSITNIQMIRTITRGIKKRSCTSLFMALYFFDTAASLWWLMLTISWFMSAGLRWVTEAIEGVSHIFHLIAWSISGVLTITVLALGEIEGDVMSGVCYVGLWDQENLRLFVMLPKMICLVIGCLLLTYGFILLWRTRKSLKQEGTQTVKLERFMLKIGSYSFLFIFFTFILLCCCYYEQENLNSWLLAWLSEVCKSREYSIPCPKLLTQPMAPNYYTFLIKYFSAMSIGIFSCLLVIAPKTMISYKQLLTGSCSKSTPTHPLTSVSQINHHMKSSHTPLKDNGNIFSSGDQLDHGTYHHRMPIYSS